MPVHSGPATALMILLLVAGVQKVVDPAATSGALRASGLPSVPILVRFLGMVEVAVAGSFLVSGGRLPAILGAALYFCFAVFVLNALVRDLPLSSCGCLGATETPPTVVHVVLNVAAASVLGAAVIIPIAPMGGLVGQELVVVVPYLLFTGATVYLLYALLAVLPLVSVRAVRSTTPLPMPGSRIR